MKKWCLSLMMMAFSIMGTMAMADELKIEVMQEGNGDIAEHGQRVTVHYEGRLTDDTVFDASRPRGQPFGFTIGAGQVIQGWEQGVAGMKVGEMRRLTIPAELGYGVAGAVDLMLVLAVLSRRMQPCCLILSCWPSQWQFHWGRQPRQICCKRRKTGSLSSTSGALMNGRKQA